MAFQRIRIKNTNVSGKTPGADKLDTAELCINLKDQKLFSKDADGNIFEIGGRVDSGPTPPSTDNETGDLFWDGDFLLVWNGSEWVPVGQSDLDYTPAADGGTITNTNGEDAELPLVDETNAGLMSPEDYKKLGDMPAVISGDTQPGSPSLGDIWIDTSDCPPTLNIWDDCEDPGNPIWTPIGGGGGGDCAQGPVSISSSNNTEIGSTLTAIGGNGIDDGSALTATYAWTGAKTGTGATIAADVEGDYTVTATITCTDGSTLSSSAVWTISDSYVDMVNNTPPVIAVLGEGLDGAYEGNSIYVATNATVVNGDTPVIVENQWFIDTFYVATGNMYPIPPGTIGGSITCKQLFRDARSNELLSAASNIITILDRPADAITFDAVITDDGTPEANTPGHVLTASAENIVGGTAPVEYAYEWKVGGLTMGSNKTLNLINTFVGQVVICDITVAEPDGSNPETRTATYGKTIESGLKVAKGVITPNVDVEVGDTLTGSAAVTDAAGAVTEVHVWELDGSEAQRGSNATYLTTAEGTVRYRKEATDSHKTVIGDWSDPVIVTDPVQTGPNAVMSGLRFDPDRETKLERTADLTGMTEFTISLWAKITENVSNSYAFSIPCKTLPIDGSAIKYSENQGISARPQSGIWKWYGAGAGDFDLGTCTLNTWQHIVISCDGTTISGYVNGVKAASTASAGDYSSELIRVGNRLHENTGDDLIFPGYLSDVYFVEQALEATDFGKFFEGKWGPLDSSDVLASIGYVESPADSAPNYERKWSDDATAAVSNGTANSTEFAFDGNTSTRVTSDANGANLTFTMNPPLEVEHTLRIYAGDNNEVKIGPDTEYVPQGKPDWITFKGERSVSSIICNAQSGNDKGNIFAIEVDGRILIDGPVDNSRVWSDQIDDDVQDAFDGSTNDYWEQDSGTTNTWTTAGLPTLETLVFKQPGTSDSFTLTIDGDVYDSSKIDFTIHEDPQTLTINLDKTYDNPVIVITPQTDTQTGSYTGAYWEQVIWNGKILVDSPPAWNTSQVWSDSFLQLPFRYHNSNTLVHSGFLRRGSSSSF